MNRKTQNLYERVFKPLKYYLTSNKKININIIILLLQSKLAL